MIDLHSHVLPGLDDGSADLDETLAMLRIAVEEGIDTIVATPHFDAHDRSYPELVAARLEEVRRAATAAQIPIAVLPGFELPLTPHLVDAASDGPALGLGGTHYLLVEVSLVLWPPYVAEALFRLQAAGFRPILAHAERYRAIADDRRLAADLVARGALLQVNAGSLLGENGPRVARGARALVERGLVSFLATDAHSPRRRAPRLRAARAAVERLAGNEVAEALSAGNPAAVLAGRPLPPAPPVLRRRHPLGALFGLGATRR